MEYIRKITNWGSSIGLALPTDLLKYLNIKKGDIIKIRDEQGKHGPYITVWKEVELSLEDLDNEQE